MYNFSGQRKARARAAGISVVKNSQLLDNSNSDSDFEVHVCFQFHYCFEECDTLLRMHILIFKALIQNVFNLILPG